MGDVTEFFAVPLAGLAEALKAGTSAPSAMPATIAPRISFPRMPIPFRIFSFAQSLLHGAGLPSGRKRTDALQNPMNALSWGGKRLRSSIVSVSTAADSI
ncbi:hypothetical protein ACFYMW_31395 [Streptomyces sp. NPDC006692]|uniref:hypothetical protein n=1 Tax=Streptomyces sp. NPDC006692 TaxID=3364758 RepID=UPI00367A3FDB